MKIKLRRQICVATILSMIVSGASAFAQTDFITFTGSVDNANAVSVMILKKDTCTNAINPNEVLDSDTACYVYGGGNNSHVYGATNVTFGGNAITNFIFGAGSAENGTANATNINIIGGNVMNVYGGANNAVLNDCNAHIVMNGGTVEALFGGSRGGNFVGNTCVDVFGGTLTRRVYTGCYNNMDYYLIGASWDSDYYVKGTTTLRLKPGVSVITSSDTNRGLFCGSRTENKHTDEKNFVIYLDDSYNQYKNYMGEQGSTAASHLKNYTDYTVAAMMWDGQFIPLTSAYNIVIQK